MARTSLARSFWIAIGILVVVSAACARPTITPSPPAPAPTSIASLDLAATGTEPCGIVPDWGCTYFIQVQGPDRTIHEGWFDEGAIVGDVPTQLGAGTYQITFLKQRVSDVSSQNPVPGGSPRLTNRSDVFASCVTTVDVKGPAQIRVDVAFEEFTCTATASSTGG